MIQDRANPKMGRRMHATRACVLPVELEHEGKCYEAESRNISLGGMYVCTRVSLPFGARLRLRFRLPDLDEDTVCEAVVRWQGEDGYGVQFGSLRALDVWGINQLFRERRSGPAGSALG